jgi:hypothetical protein
LLLWRFKDNLQLAHIAQLLGIHQSSVTRRLQSIYRKLRNHVYRALSSQHGMSDAGIRECFEDFEDVSENPHHWLSILDSARAGTRSRPRVLPSGRTCWKITAPDVASQQAHQGSERSVVQRCV